MRRGALAFAAAVAAVAILSSCAPAYDEETEAVLRGHVLAVSQASATGDWQGAVTTLDVLAGDVSEARADGKLDDERYRNIRSAMELVRVDLEAAIQAAADEAARARLLEEQARLQQQLTELQNQGDGGAPETGGGPATGGGEENKKGKNGKGEDQKGEGGKEGKGDKK